MEKLEEELYMHGRELERHAQELKRIKQSLDEIAYHLPEYESVDAEEESSGSGGFLLALWILFLTHNYWMG